MGFKIPKLKLGLICFFIQPRPPPISEVFPNFYFSNFDATLGILTHFKIEWFENQNYTIKMFCRPF